MVRKKRGLAGLLESDQETTGKAQGKKPAQKSTGKHRATPAGLDYMNAGKGRAETNRPTSARGGRINEYDPSDLVMWPLHNRDPNFLTDERVQGLAEQFLSVGQEQPALGRPAPKDSDAKIELIYGARRLAASRAAGTKLLVEVVDADDQEALQIMEAENAEREDVSAYEKGRHYQQLLEKAVYQSQSEMVRKLGLKRSSIVRLLKIAQIPHELMLAIGSPYEMPLTKLDKLADILAKNPDLEPTLLKVASKARGEGKDTRAVLTAVLGAARNPKKPSQPKPKILRDKSGNEIGRISGTPGEGRVTIALERSPTQETLYQDIADVLKKYGL